MLSTGMVVHRVGTQQKQTLPFRNKTKCRLLLFRFEEDMFKEFRTLRFLFQRLVLLTILKLPISLNVGTGYYIITEKDGYSRNLTAALLSP
jgi:hypothetical protein